MLYIDPRDKIVMLKRLGKITDKNQMLVVFENEQTATEVLSRSYLLKELEDRENNSLIYINRDMSPEEFKMAFERREKRREQQRQQ